MGVDGPGGVSDRRVPHFPHDPRSLDRGRRVAREQQEQLEFLRRQVEGVAVECGASSCDVDAETADRHLGGGTRAAVQSAHTGQQLGQAEWLGDVVVGSGVQADDDVDLLGAGGEHENRQVRGDVLTDLPAHLDAVAIRQAQIEDDQFGPARKRMTGDVEISRH